VKASEAGVAPSVASNVNDTALDDEEELMRQALEMSLREFGESSSADETVAAPAAPVSSSAPASTPAPVAAPPLSDADGDADFDEVSV